MEPLVMSASSERLNVKCDKCTHKAGSHNLVTGKHECLVYGCNCQWFKLKMEVADDIPERS